MFAQVLNHPSQYPRHPVIHQTPFLQLGQGHSKLLIGFHCPGPQHGNLDHLLHVLFNLRCRLVVLQEEELISDSSQRNCAYRPLVAGVAGIMSWRRDVPLNLYTCAPSAVTLSATLGRVCAESCEAEPWPCVATTNIRLPRNTLGSKNCLSDTPACIHSHKWPWYSHCL